MNVMNTTDQSFDQDVLKNTKLTLVDFWAQWCGPCKMLAPTLDTLAQEMATDVSICKVNVDENPESATKYGVRSIPFLTLFKDGQMVDSTSGNRPKSELQQWIQKHL